MHRFSKTPVLIRLHGGIGVSFRERRDAGEGDCGGEFIAPLLGEGNRGGGADYVADDVGGGVGAPGGA